MAVRFRLESRFWSIWQADPEHITKGLRKKFSRNPGLRNRKRKGLWVLWGRYVRTLLPNEGNIDWWEAFAAEHDYTLTTIERWHRDHKVTGLSVDGDVLLALLEKECIPKSRWPDLPDDNLREYVGLHLVSKSIFDTGKHGPHLDERPPDDLPIEIAVGLSQFLMLYSLFEDTSILNEWVSLLSNHYDRTEREVRVEEQLVIPFLERSIEFANDIISLQDGVLRPRHLFSLIKKFLAMASKDLLPPGSSCRCPHSLPVRAFTKPYI